MDLGELTRWVKEVCEQETPDVPFFIYAFGKGSLDFIGLIQKTQSNKGDGCRFRTSEGNSYVLYKIQMVMR